MSLRNQRSFGKSPAAAKGESRKTRSFGRLSAISAIVLVSLLALLLFIRPYKRLEDKLTYVISQNAPGIKMDSLHVRFPLALTATNIQAPVNINNQQRWLRVERLDGTLSMLPLVKGLVEAELNSDFFGGVLWVKVQTKALSGSEKKRLLSFDARARRVDLARVSDFVEAPTRLTGACDIDAKGEMEENNPDSLAGSGLLIGSAIEIPPLELESATLPANHSVQGKTKISIEQGRLSIHDLLLAGAAYDISGTGAVTLEEPLEDSALACLLGIVFKEPFTITDSRIPPGSADGIIDTLINSKSKVNFRVNGPVKAPQVELDPASLISVFNMNQ